MNRIWANRLEDSNNSRWTFEDIPAGRKDAVKAILAEDVAVGKNGMTAKRFEQITGESYTA